LGGGGAWGLCRWRGAPLGGPSESTTTWHAFPGRKPPVKASPRRVSTPVGVAARRWRRPRYVVGRGAGSGGVQTTSTPRAVPCWLHAVLCCDPRHVLMYGLVCMDFFLWSFLSRARGRAPGACDGLVRGLVARYLLPVALPFPDCLVCPSPTPLPTPP
jgi:hypothetical protein